jgi:hypothetical protein
MIPDYLILDLLNKNINFVETTPTYYKISNLPEHIDKGYDIRIWDDGFYEIRLQAEAMCLVKQPYTSFGELMKTLYQLNHLLDEAARMSGKY